MENEQITKMKGLLAAYVNDELTIAKYTALKNNDSQKCKEIDEVELAIQTIITYLEK